MSFNNGLDGVELRSDQLKELYTMYYRLVLGLAKRYFPHMPKDHTADFFVDSYKSILENGHFHEHSEAYIRVCALNFFKSQYRKLSKRRTEQFKDNPSVDSYFDNRRTNLHFSNEFENSLNVLSKRDKKVILMQLEGYKDEEIATETECSVDVVRQSRKRARAKLKQFYNL